MDAALAPVAPSAALRDQLPAVAVCLWGVGVMLYLILIVIIFLRLLLVEVTPTEMGPAYWIAMGATAISVRAAAGILVVHGPRTTILVTDLRPFLIGLSVVLWALQHLVDPLARAVRPVALLGCGAIRWPTSRGCGAWSSPSACTPWPLTPWGGAPG